MKPSFSFLFFLTLALFASVQNSYAQWLKTKAPDTLKYYSIAETASNLFVVTGDRVLRSGDNGNGWEPVDTGRVPINNIVGSESFLYGWFEDYETSHGSLYRSSNEGITWTMIDRPRKIYGGEVTCLLVDGQNLMEGQHAPWGAHYGSYPYGDLFKSTDNGNDWSRIEHGLPSFVNDSLYGPPILALLAHDGYFFAGVGLGNTNDFAGCIYRSSDDGSNWSSIDSNFWVTSFAPLGHLIFASGRQGIICSSNDGITWRRIITDIIDTNISQIISSAGRLFATDGMTIIYSGNAGSTWSTVNSNLPTSKGVSIFVDTENIFVATSDLFGVWRQQLLNFELSPAQVQGSLIPSIQIAPNPTKGEISIIGIGIQQVNVTNIVGAPICTTLAHNIEEEMTLDLTNQPAGTYFMRVQTPRGVTVKRVIKE